jgi:lipoprotein-anchoring transpeptidase ErfK/SrfK
MNTVRISIAEQMLELRENAASVRRYPVSTSKYGAGEKYGSFCTPRGRHLIRAKIGAGAPVNTVFVKRRPTGETYDAELGRRFPGRDWMLTRLLWLSGCERGFNRLGDVDTMRRYIYIHGSPDSAVMGQPGSIGCIRMRNDDLLDLFERVEPGTPVEIIESPL